MDYEASEAGSRFEPPTAARQDPYVPVAYPVAQVTATGAGAGGTGGGTGGTAGAVPAVYATPYNVDDDVR